MEFVWKIYVVKAKATIVILECIQTVLEEKGNTTISVSRSDHFFCRPVRTKLQANTLVISLSWRCKLEAWKLDQQT